MGKQEEKKGEKQTLINKWVPIDNLTEGLYIVNVGVLVSKEFLNEDGKLYTGSLHFVSNTALASDKENPGFYNLEIEGRKNW